MYKSAKKINGANLFTVSPSLYYKHFSCEGLYLFTLKLLSEHKKTATTPGKERLLKLVHSFVGT